MIRKTLSTVGITFLIVGAAQASIVADLQEYWPLDGNANATQDTTFNATFTGSTETYAAGKFGQGIDLERDGGDYLTVGGVGDEFDHVGGSVTISLWLTTESFGTNWQAMIANGEGNAWRLARFNGTDNAGYAGGVGDIQGGAINAPGFHHIVGISEAGVEARLWVDGVKVTGGVPNLASDNGNDANMMIGNNPDSTGRSWDGVIDDVAIWSTALTDDEVLSIWNDGDGASISSLVPEPSSSLLSVLGVMALGLRRRSR